MNTAAITTLSASKLGEDVEQPRNENYKPKTKGEEEKKFHSMPQMSKISSDRRPSNHETLASR